MANKKTTKELEFKLKQKLNNFNPEEVEAYLEVLLRKCLAATKEKDYLTLGSVEDILNKSIVILASKVLNFNIMYSNLKLKIATEELAKYIELDNTEAFNFFNMLPEYIEEPSGISIETKKEMVIEVYYITEHIERSYNFLKLLLDYFYMLSKGIIGTEEGSKIEAAFSHLIELAYNKLEESFQELEKYNVDTDSLEVDLILASNEEEKKATSDILFYLYSIQDFKEKLEELKANPFKEVTKFLFKDWIALIFGVKEPIEDLEAFEDSLKEENEEIIEVYKYLVEGYFSGIPTYNFNTFEIVPAKEPEADPEEPEVQVPEKFKEDFIEHLENLPEWLKDRFNITEEKITAKKEKLLKAKNSSEENVPEEDSSEKVAAEDSSENAVPINES